ncbi:hypothetical protein [Actinoplanes utahensis]|uniref:hypothetical protein n=1 Tax=Actinoplanes utahensis TaxID=1869 RepID=UPI000AA7A02B|nr:hypothetical protein [Actinoplanes utahensis]GIF29928.1 hypothetical protein Aut01nite_29140 [Actinoplanes utahensis]
MTPEEHSEEALERTVRRLFAREPSSLERLGHRVLSGQTEPLPPRLTHDGVDLDTFDDSDGDPGFKIGGS